jgi:multisubunit Na+/H+ antiporter MnhG subunit
MQKKRDELKDLRQFGMVLAAILIVFGSIHFLRHRIVPAGWFCGIGMIVLCLGLLAPGLLKNVYAVFLKLAHALGWFNTRAILIIIYFLLLTPIALIMKMFGKDPLNRKIYKGELSYWVKRQTIKPAKDQLEKQF